MFPHCFVCFVSEIWYDTTPVTPPAAADSAKQGDVEMSGEKGMKEEKKEEEEHKSSSPTGDSSVSVVPHSSPAQYKSIDIDLGEQNWILFIIKKYEVR